MIKEVFDERKHKSGSCVYLIKEKHTDSYKIGKSTDVKRRLNGLQVANPNELKLVGYYWSDEAKKEESQFKADYKDKNIRGEWFKLNGCDVVSILNEFKKRIIPEY